jgi:hypothetical protein
MMAAMQRDEDLDLRAASDLTDEERAAVLALIRETKDIVGRMLTTPERRPLISRPSRYTAA